MCLPIKYVATLTDQVVREDTVHQDFYNQVYNQVFKQIVFYALESYKTSLLGSQPQLELD
jgi:hypothetical protein